MCVLRYDSTLCFFVLEEAFALFVKEIKFGNCTPPVVFCPGGPYRTVKHVRSLDPRFDDRGARVDQIKIYLYFIKKKILEKITKL